MTNADFRELTGAAGDRIGMTRDARCSVKHRAYSRTHIMYLFKELLIESKGVTGRFCDSVADARGTGVLAEGRRIKTRRRSVGDCCAIPTSPTSRAPQTHKTRSVALLRIIV